MPGPSRKLVPAVTVILFYCFVPELLTISENCRNPGAVTVSVRIVIFSGIHDKPERGPFLPERISTDTIFGGLCGFLQSGVLMPGHPGLLPGKRKQKQCPLMTKTPGRGLPGVQNAGNCGQLLLAIVVIVLFDLFLPASGRGTESLVRSHGFHGKVDNGFIVGAYSGR